jgi:hypoxanthine phosphoribosyltransferase
MSKKIKPKVLIPEVRLQNRIKELAQEIDNDYIGKEITAICILKGSFVFFSDLLRQMESSVVCEFLGLSSYGNKKISSGEVKITLDINEPLEGKHVIVFEDIVDSGLTLRYLVNNLKARNPESLKICSLLFKPECLKSEVDLDYVGFKIGKEFVVGYGVDYAERFRGLPYIGVMAEDEA